MLRSESSHVKDPTAMSLEFHMWDLTLLLHNDFYYCYLQLILCILVQDTNLSQPSTNTGLRYQTQKTFMRNGVGV